jgi:hypothetical protein
MPELMTYAPPVLGKPGWHRLVTAAARTTPVAKARAAGAVTRRRSRRRSPIAGALRALLAAALGAVGLGLVLLGWVPVLFLALALFLPALLPLLLVVLGILATAGAGGAPEGFAGEQAFQI